MVCGGPLGPTASSAHRISNQSSSISTASTEAETVEATIIRRPIAPDVVVEAVDDDGLVGLYFRPPGDAAFPAALVVGGSGGGFLGADTTAALLASRGIASLALAYLGLPGLPPGLAEVPLEYFATALRWLATRPEVEGKAAVVGHSRGGELALLLGVAFTEVGAVVARAPSSVVWGSFGPGSGPEVPAWTLAGRPVDRMTSSDDAAWAEVNKTSPLVCTPGFLADLRNAEAVSDAAIHVERASCPILLISGKTTPCGRPRRWPSRSNSARPLTDSARALCICAIGTRDTCAHGRRGSRAHSPCCTPSITSSWRSGAPSVATQRPRPTLGRGHSSSFTTPWPALSAEVCGTF